MPHILIVDDNPQILEVIQAALDLEGLSTSIATDAMSALALLTGETNFDAILLDIELPDINGFEVCKSIRTSHEYQKVANIPIAFMTLHSHEEYIVQGLDAGGDDYLTKPIDLRILVSRVRALLRRGPGGKLDATSEYMTIGNFRLHATLSHVLINDCSVTLTSMEHKLLYCLCIFAPKILSLDDLMEYVWEYPAGAGDVNIAYVTISRLRKKLEVCEGGEQVIRNVRGEGYTVSTASDI